jgi:hypothetical protein
MVDDLLFRDGTRWVVWRRDELGDAAHRGTVERQLDDRERDLARDQPPVAADHDHIGVASSEELVPLRIHRNGDLTRQQLRARGIAIQQTKSRKLRVRKSTKLVEQRRHLVRRHQTGERIPSARLFANSWLEVPT